MWLPEALAEEDSDVEPVLRGKVFHDRLVKSDMEIGNSGSTCMCSTSAPIYSHSVAAQRIDVSTNLTIVSPEIYPDILDKIFFTISQRLWSKGQEIH